MTVQTLTIDQLVVSDLNVRVNEEDANATSALETSIAAVGLYLPLVVHPITVVGAKRKMARAPAPQLWGVLDGGRRCRAIRRLVDSGKLPADWPIDCVIRDVDPARITELSLGAYLLTRELREYEISNAVARMLSQGLSAEEIATNLGQRPEWVAQQLRLGNLEIQIFEAFAAGKISIDEARAYAATADKELQHAAFQHFADQMHFHNRPEQIRAWLKVGDRELDRLLKFVGEDVYRKAGGAYELDLFAGDSRQRGRIADEGKLRELAENRLGFERQELRRRTGRSDLRFISELPKIPVHGYTDHSLELQPQVLADDTIVLPKGDVVARLEVRDTRDGTGVEAHVTWWWESRKAQAEARKDARKTSDSKAVAAATPGGPVDEGAGFSGTVNYAAAQQARAMVKEEHGLTADGLHVIRSLRRELLRALLVTDATDNLTESGLGTDYIVWAQLRQELRDADRAHTAGARGLASGWSGAEDNEPRDVVNPHLEQTEAHAIWQRAVGRIKAQPFIELADPAAALQAFVEADKRTKDLAGAVLAGLALVRSANVPGWRVRAHDQIAALAGGDDVEMLRSFWMPSDDFIALFPKMRRLELAQDALGGPGRIDRADEVRLKALTAARDGEATRGATEILQRQCWVHPMLGFEMPEPIVREAAE